MQLEPKRYILIVVLLWVMRIFASLSWNLFQIKKSTEKPGTDHDLSIP